MLDNILLSFMVNSSDKKGICPKNVQVWVGPEEDDLYNLGLMEPVEDDHYLAFGTRVLGINMRRMES